MGGVDRLVTEAIPWHINRDLRCAEASQKRTCGRHTSGAMHRPWGVPCQVVSHAVGALRARMRQRMPCLENGPSIEPQRKEPHHIEASGAQRLLRLNERK